MPSGGAWKRFGPAHCTGAARSENTGSVSQYRPSSLRSMVEWPRRHRLASGAASMSAAVSGCTGSGAPGTAVFGFAVQAFQIMASISATPWRRRATALRKRPSDRRGAPLGSEESGMMAAAIRTMGDHRTIHQNALNASREPVSTSFPALPETTSRAGRNRICTHTAHATRSW